MQRQAAAIAFGAMLEGPSTDRIVPMVSSALEAVVNLLGDPSLQVKFAASSTISKIAEFHPESILSHGKFLQILQILVSSLSFKAKISRNICWTFNFLAENMKLVLDIPGGPRKFFENYELKFT